MKEEKRVGYEWRRKRGWVMNEGGKEKKRVNYE